jgi:hypothetical protein
MVIHPKDRQVRYVRTDVGEAYRWDSARSEWMPMKVFNQSDQSGMPAATAAAPSPSGELSLAVDPSSTSTVYMACSTQHSSDVGSGSGINIYKSVDGGKQFTAGNLNIPGDANDDWRTSGERLAVDPQNSKVVYFGSSWRNIYANPKVGSGLYRSTDGGATWNPVTGPGAPAGTANVINVLFGKMVKGFRAPIYAIVGDGDVYSSNDSGQTWSNISAGTQLSGHASMGSIAPDGSLWVAQGGASTVWKYNGVVWSAIRVDTGDGSVHCVAVDPQNLSEIWAVGNGGGVGYSLDGGDHWTSLGKLKYENRLGWLPQTVGSSIWYNTRSVSTLLYDDEGYLWIAMGQEGVLRYRPTGHETYTSPPQWIIDSRGIEELVSGDVVLPKGGEGKAIVAAEDTTGFVISNPDDFSAVQIPLQGAFGLIAQGTGVAVCPNDPKYVAITCSNTYMVGKNLSGFSMDGGATWQPFSSELQYQDGDKKFDVQAGAIAVSVRTHPVADGSDVHLVQLPVYGMAPEYSHDGGRTWHNSSGLPIGANGASLGNGFQGFWGLALKQRPLYADPFTADRFYLKFTNAPSSFYVTTDGGETWQPQTNAGLPNYTHHGQLAVNDIVRNDLWYADGWEGATEHGLWHSTDGGVTFQKVPVFRHAITLGLGKGSAAGARAPYAVYVYGQTTSDEEWGVFGSFDAGTTWNRISYYPTGIYDQPTCMAASWDQFGDVWIGFDGNSFVYSTYSADAQLPR